jgi:hypothetical protein
LPGELLDAGANRIGPGPASTGSTFSGYGEILAAHLCEGRTAPGFNQVHQGRLAAISAMQAKIRGL